MQADVERRQPEEPEVQNFRGDKVVAASAGDTAVQLKGLLAEAGASDEEIAACSSNYHLLKLLDSLRAKKQEAHQEAALATTVAAGEEEKYIVDVLVVFGDMVRLRNFSSFFPSREMNLLMSIDHVDLSLPTCLLLQIHNGDNFDLMEDNGLHLRNIFMTELAYEGFKFMEAVTNRVAFYDDGDDLRLEKFISIANRCVKGVIGVDAESGEMISIPLKLDYCGRYNDPGPGLFYDLPDGKNSVYPFGDPQQPERTGVNGKEQWTELMQSETGRAIMSQTNDKHVANAHAQAQAPCKNKEKLTQEEADKIAEEGVAKLVETLKDGVDSFSF